MNYLAKKTLHIQTMIIILLFSCISINKTMAGGTGYRETNSFKPFSNETPSGNFYNNNINYRPATYGNPTLRAIGNDDDEDDLNQGGIAGDKDQNSNDMPVGTGLPAMLLCCAFYFLIKERRHIMHRMRREKKSIIFK
ncbi:hypothetical protein D0T49_08340 [Paludibacter sp. 221]|uniref:hypothetical protein n=1 Tax=Paludibacter sp. 221 TaxID=2302939 RepID=UPI0013D11836|nr:hypothetical protein [Paludibacter sp. 221]NDV47053.1 hypothetical protein [Paludibacter sp. 221]